MKRTTVHALFGTVALAFTAMVALWTYELRGADAVNHAVAQAAARPLDGLDGSARDDRLPESRFARARALALAGRNDTAVQQYSTLIQEGSPAGVRQAALYNLANLYLRQSAAAEAGQSLAAIELAKQRYRDLLRLDPVDWDARHNLERALRMAPEDEAAFAEAFVQPVERRQVRLRGMEAGDLP